MMALKLSLILFGLVCITIGISGVPHSRSSPVTDMRLHYGLNVEGQRTHENVELNYDENYARVRTPAFGNRDAMTMIHDYNQGLTLFKQNGRCFMLNQYEDFPQRMEDWLNLDFNANGGMIEAGGDERYRFHNYKVVPFALNRTILPAVMRRECEEIDMMVLQNTVEGEEAYYQDEIDPIGSCRGAIYLPNTQYHQAKVTGGRAKRSAPAPCFVCIVNCG